MKPPGEYQLLGFNHPGGSANTYNPQGYNQFPLEQLLRPFEVTASIIGARFLPIFIAMKLDEQELDFKSEEYAAYLTSLH